MWTLTPRGNRFVIRNTATSRVVTIAQASSNQGAHAISWPVIGAPDQNWTVRRVS